MLRPIILAICLLSPVIVYADWQYAKWGMSPDEVLKASKGLAVEIKQTDTQKGTILSAPYQAAGTAFTARFIFDESTNRLVRVNLSPIKSDSCVVFRSSIIDKYGKHETEELTKFQGNSIQKTRWKDIKNKNKLEFTEIMASALWLCHVDYAPINLDDNNGF